MSGACELFHAFLSEQLALPPQRLFLASESFRLKCVSVHACPCCVLEQEQEDIRGREDGA